MSVERGQVMMDVQSDTLCVLYEPATGEIAYTHRVITLVGGEASDQSSMENAARELAAERGRAVDRLAVLHVRGQAMEQIGAYRVDVDTGQLVFRTLKEAGIDLVIPGVDVDIDVGGGIDLGPLG